MGSVVLFCFAVVIVEAQREMKIDEGIKIETEIEIY